MDRFVPCAADFLSNRGARSFFIPMGFPAMRNRHPRFPRAIAREMRETASPVPNGFGVRSLLLDWKGQEASAAPYHPGLLPHHA